MNIATRLVGLQQPLCARRRLLSTIGRLAIHSSATPPHSLVHRSGKFAKNSSIMNKAPMCQELLQVCPLHSSIIPLQNSKSKCDPDSKFKLTLETVNENLRKMEYAVRGKIVMEAKQIMEDIRKGDTSYPFERIIFCNIGDCHAMGQKPITFVRQLLAACTNPDDLIYGGLSVYPSDVEERAQGILAACDGHSIGSYSDSRGIEIIRKHVAEFISERDGHPCTHDNIYLVNGASEGIKSMLYVVVDEMKKTGIMIPMPQYPLYTAALAELNAVPISYYLDEEKGWGINMDSLKPSIMKAKEECEPRAMVVINPGNPTGSYLPKQDIIDIIRFCHQHGLILFTDEVYQENLHEENAKVYPFRKVLLGMPTKYHNIQMISFNSTSKGLYGECGIRGGYMQIMGMDDEVVEQIRKHTTIGLCPNTPGQVVVDALVRRPKSGDPSFQKYQNEVTEIAESLKKKAKMVHTRLNNIPGVYCNQVIGAMYAFPRVEIPEEAWEDCRAEDPNIKLDTYYCLEFLRQKGVCVVPGSGFGQKEGTWHFRTTILPSEEDLDFVLTAFEDFHLNFLRRYGKIV